MPETMKTLSSIHPETVRRTLGKQGACIERIAA